MILIGCGCLSLVGVIAIAISAAVVIPLLSSRYQSRLESLEIENSPLVVPDGWIRFQNIPGNIVHDWEPELKEHFAAFSFNYPDDTFGLVADNSCFARVDSTLDHTSQGKVMLESFIVDSAWSVKELEPGMDIDLIFPSLLNDKKNEFEAKFSNFHELSRFPDTVGPEQGLAMTFEAEMKDESQKAYKIFGKTIVIRPKGEMNGVAITLLASEFNPEVAAPEFVGVAGSAAEILSTFRFTAAEPTQNLDE